jgi:CheY-like chemotaxis protein
VVRALSTGLAVATCHSVKLHQHAPATNFDAPSGLAGGRVLVSGSAVRFNWGAPRERIGGDARGGLGRPRNRIEDNQDAADTLREVLEIDEHVVEVAYTGREGIEKAQAFRPDIVLCDIGLPEMDGYEIARTMRADPEFGNVGLIALSGYAQPEDVEMAMEAGFDAHLAKPPSIDALERALADVGSSRQDQRALH